MVGKITSSVVPYGTDTLSCNSSMASPAAGLVVHSQDTVPRGVSCDAAACVNRAPTAGATRHRVQPGSSLYRPATRSYGNLVMAPKA